MHQRLLIAVVAFMFGSLAGCGGGSSGGESSTGGSTTGSASSGASAADAARFLEQSSFGPTDASLAAVEASGIAAALDAQLATPSTGYPGYSYMDPNSSIGCPTGSAATCGRDNYTIFPVQTQFFRNALTGPDQLRQRVAFALSQILVTSGIVIVQPYAMAAYQQILLDDAFGNYRALLADVTLSPAMGHYLDMVNNDKANATLGTKANENYGREINQLFSVGVSLLNADGSLQLDSGGKPIPTYTQAMVEGFAAAFTGWTYPPLPGATAKWTDPANFSEQMVPIAAHHDTNAKTLMNGTSLPAGQDASTDLSDALTNIYDHPNVGPFIGKQLIQFLVTSNPSPAYVSRISAVFANNGEGVRGDLKAVVRAILLDPEARGDLKTDPGYGRMRDADQYLASVIRGVGGKSYSDGVYLQSAGSQLAQPVFDANSVFSFYPPDYALQGTSLVAPSFGIFTAATAFARANVLNTLLAGAIKADSTVANSTGTSLDLSGWQAVAADSGALADKIDTLFFHGAMSTAVRSTITQTVNAIPATDTLSRARAGLYLALSSIQYQVEQ